MKTLLQYKLPGGARQAPPTLRNAARDAAERYAAAREYRARPAFEPKTQSLSENKLDSSINNLYNDSMIRSAGFRQAGCGCLSMVLNRSLNPIRVRTNAPRKRHPVTMHCRYYRINGRAHALTFGASARA